MPIEKKKIATKKPATKGNAKGKVDTKKPAATKVVAAMKVLS